MILLSIIGKIWKIHVYLIVNSNSIINNYIIIIIIIIILCDVMNKK